MTSVISLSRSTINYFILIGFMLPVLSLAYLPARGQGNQLAFEVGAGPNLTLNHETFNQPQPDLFTVRDKVGYHFYLEIEFKFSVPVAVSLGYSNSLLQLGNTGIEMEALYLRPTYFLTTGERLSLGVSVMGGLQFHNHKSGPKVRTSKGWINGQLRHSNTYYFHLLPKRHEKIPFIGSQLSLCYELGKASSLNFKVGANASMRKLMEASMEIFDINRGTNLVKMENWGEFLYLTIGYRLGFDLRSRKS